MRYDPIPFNFLSEQAVKDFMKQYIYITVLFLILTFVSFAKAQVNFFNYVKRNHQVLKSTAKESETVAFEEKKMFRSLASEDAPKKTILPTTPPADGGETSPDSQDSSSTPSGPNR